MARRALTLSIALILCPFAIQPKGRDWQTGDVASMEVIRTPVGKKLVYRYSYTVHAQGRSYTFDESKKLPLTVNGPVRFSVEGDRIRVLDERGKEHHESILKKAVDK